MAARSTDTASMGGFPVNSSTNLDASPRDVSGAMSILVKRGERKAVMSGALDLLSCQFNSCNVKCRKGWVSLDVGTKSLVMASGRLHIPTTSRRIHGAYRLSLFNSVVVGRRVNGCPN